MFNTWGGSFSGPVRVPKVYNGKNKTFFLFGYEGIHDSRPRHDDTTNTIPTPAEHQGDFSALLANGGASYTVYDPATRTGPNSAGRFTETAFPGNKIPSNRFDPVGVKIMSYFPSTELTPGDPLGLSNYQDATTAEKAKYWNGTWRVDQNLGDRQRFFVRYSTYTRNSTYNNYFNNAYVGIVEVVVVSTVAGIGAIADEEALPVAQVLVDAPGSVPVLGLFGGGGVLIVGQAEGIARGQLGRGEIAHDLDAYRVEPVAGNLVARKRGFREASGGIGARACRRVVNGVAGSAVGQQRREIALVLGRSRHGVGGVVMARARIVDALVAKQEERLVLAVVHLRDTHRTAEGAAPRIEHEVRPRRAGLVQEEVVGPETGALEAEVRGAVEIVGARFDADVGHAALRLAELRIEGGRLHLELLHDVGGGHVGRRHLEGIGARSGGRAVDGDVVQQAAGSAHREVHDVGGFEGTIETHAAVEGAAGREADQQEGVAVGERQVRHPLGVHHGAQRGGFGIEECCLRAHRHGLFRSADFERHVDGQTVRYADFNARPHGLLEAGGNDLDLIDTRRQRRRPVNALGIGGEIRFRPHGGVGDHDLGSRYHGTARVGDPAADGAFCVLRPSWRNEQAENAG